MGSLDELWDKRFEWESDNPEVVADWLSNKGQHGSSGSYLPTAKKLAEPYKIMKEIEEAKFSGDLSGILSRIEKLKVGYDEVYGSYNDKIEEIIKKEEIIQQKEVQRQESERLKKDGYINEAFFNTDGSLREQWNYKEKNKYFYVDKATSGVFLVNKSNNSIFRIKSAYGVINTHKYCGQLDSINAKDLFKLKWW